MQPNETDQTMQTELEQVGQQTEQSQESTITQPARPRQHTKPGTRPLIGT
jgi:hypothetical protein